MKTIFALAVGMLLAMFIVSGSAPDAVAQNKAGKADKAAKAAPAKKTNYQGVVTNTSPDKKSISMRVGTTPREVIYDANTKFLYGHSDKNTPGAVAQIKQSYYISCSGTVNEKSQLMASECVYRETK
jgi:hypothetical protein